MAWNFGENNLFSAIMFGDESLMEECLGKTLGGFGDCWNFNWELVNSCDYRRGETAKISDDILDLLPSDPFGMDISTTFSALTGWLEDIEKDFGLSSLGFETDGVEVKKGDDRLFAGLNLVWNGAMRFHPEVGDTMIGEKSNCSDKELRTPLHEGAFVSDGGVDEFLGFFYDKYCISSKTANEVQGCANIYSDVDGGAPHDALFFALGFLDARDLLSVGRVCKSLRDAVQNDPLLWRNIYIDHPLSDRITDEDLLHLTSRAQGTLQCLSLVGCLKITDNGLRCVLENNPGLTKLSVPGCLRLTVEGTLRNLKAFKSSGTPGIKHLRIGGLFAVTNKQFEELKLLVGTDNCKQLDTHKPRFYHGVYSCLSCDDDLALDIETCPRCQSVRQVYDCPAESCQGKHQAAQSCRACTLCIARCLHCGCCINGRDYEETFCLDMLCLDCWKQLLTCQKRQEETGVSSSKRTIFHQQARYHLCLHAKKN